MNPQAARDLGRTLARIHRITPAGGTLPGLPIPMLAPAKVEVARLRTALAGASQARPALEYCLAWLDANAPGPRSLVLVHGDFRTATCCKTTVSLRSSRKSPLGTIRWRTSAGSAPAAEPARRRDPGGGWHGRRRAFYDTQRLAANKIDER
jgi:hypothetical protein